MAFSLTEYQQFCPETFVYNSSEQDLLHIISGVAAELTEVIEKLLEEDVYGLRKEIGGVLYYSAMFFNEAYTEGYQGANDGLYNVLASSNGGSLVLKNFVSPIKSLISSVQKFHRGDFGYVHLLERSYPDVCAGLRAIRGGLDLQDLTDIAEQNMQILKDRKERNQIKGDGDVR